MKPVDTYAYACRRTSNHQWYPRILVLECRNYLGDMKSRPKCLFAFGMMADRNATQLGSFSATVTKMVFAVEDLGIPSALP
uniref:Transposase n=1 Tax=Steinernema glaseri TaxID=37863 RepID=A0A1I8AED1_9BILA